MRDMSPECWQDEHILCEFFCIQVRQPDDPDDYGSQYPELECGVHWAPAGQAKRAHLQANFNLYWATRRARRP